VCRSWFAGGRDAPGSCSQGGSCPDGVSGEGLRVGVQRVCVGRQAEGAAQLHGEDVGHGRAEQQVAGGAGGRDLQEEDKVLLPGRGGRGGLGRTARQQPAVSRVQGASAGRGRRAVRQSAGGRGQGPQVQGPLVGHTKRAGRHRGTGRRPPEALGQSEGAVR